MINDREINKLSYLTAGLVANPNRYYQIIQLSFDKRLIKPSIELKKILELLEEAFVIATRRLRNPTKILINVSKQLQNHDLPELRLVSSWINHSIL